MSTDGIQIGDVAVLLDDGVSGEVKGIIASGDSFRITVKFDDFGYIWSYDPDQLEVIGSVT